MKTSLILIALVLVSACGGSNDMVQRNNGSTNVAAKGTLKLKLHFENAN